MNLEGAMRLLVHWQLVLVLFLCLDAVEAMFSKRPLPDRDREMSAAQRLRLNVADLFLQNDVSATRTQTVMSDVNACGVEGFTQLAKAGGSGKHKGNIRRDMMRSCLKGSHWPDLYYARIRVYAPNLQREVVSLVPMMLPHELIGALVKFNGKAPLLQTQGLSAESAKNLAAARQELQDPELMPLGLWCDGCPCNWDRTKSVEVWSLNIPGISEWQALRLPLVTLFKQFVITENTFDDVLTVLAWSMQHLALGVYPLHRHDGTPFGQKDAKRKRQASSAIGVTAAVVELRGDWKMLKEVFRLPGWSSKTGCCWRCTATPDDIRKCGSEAHWRQESQRLSHWGLLERMHLNGKSISPIFSFPAFRTSCFLIDWLHAVDLGVCADFLGNLLFVLVSKYPGQTQTQRCSALFVELQAWYDRHQVESRLDNLTLTMIRQPGKPPKLRAKAAEARALVPFALEQAEAKFSKLDPVEHSAQLCAGHLAKCYSCLSVANYNADVMKEHCKAFCLLYCGLEATASNPMLWRVKPKLHLFQELCEFETGAPSLAWCYRDEDFGGTMSKLSRTRGGKNTALATGTHALLAFYAKNHVPVL